MAQDCLLYFAQKDALGWPIPSTLAGYNPRVALPCQNNGCNFIQLLPTPPAQPNGTKQCLHPSNLRYFYRVDRGTPQQIVPNSLIQSYNFPTSPTDGCWREVIKYC